MQLAGGTAALLLLSLALAPGALGQDKPAEGQEGDNVFMRTAIPENFVARFQCHQGGQRILELNEVKSFAPDRIAGLMTYSLATADGATHLVYLGADTTCSFAVSPR